MSTYYINKNTSYKFTSFKFDIWKVQYTSNHKCFLSHWKSIYSNWCIHLLFCLPLPHLKDLCYYIKLTHIIQDNLLISNSITLITSVKSLLPCKVMFLSSGVRVSTSLLGHYSAYHTGEETCQFRSLPHTINKE